MWSESHITKQCYLTTRYGGQISQFKFSRLFTSCNERRICDCYHLHGAHRAPLFFPFSHQCQNHIYHDLSLKILFLEWAQCKCTGHPVRALPRAISSRFLLIGIFPKRTCLVYKYDAPQAKLCHFDINPLTFPMYQVNSLEEDIWSPQTMSNDFSVCDIRRLSSFIPPNWLMPPD